MWDSLVSSSPGPPSFPFKTEVILPFFHQWEPKHDGWWYSTSSSSSLRTRRCILSGPTDICTFRFLKQSQTYTLLQWMVIHSPTPCLYLLQFIWLEILWKKTKAKKAIKYLRLLHVLGSQVSCFLTERVHIYPCLPFIINSTTLAFPTRTLAAQTISSLSSSQATCICFHLLWASFLCLGLTSSSFSYMWLG